MHKQASAYTINLPDKPPRDPNEAAFRVLGIITGEHETPKVKRAKKGAAARSEKLTPEQRSEIAKRAAEARWLKNP
jgi:hypothetical protein